ncbi:type II toxin-antitoxin system HicA family toxin [Pedobacter sp. BS3]|nr:type II toxin-antitoxin system HicA family toxin [Pedobacter sp. BS3]
MSTRKLSNISVSKFESFLELAQCKLVRQTGGHIVYSRCDCLRPIIFQSHIDPMPEFIVKNNLRILGYSKNDFFDILECKVTVKRKGNSFILSTD